MEFRDVQEDDSTAIAAVAAASLRESYGHVLDDDRIDELVDHWYAPDRVSDLVGDDDLVWIVAEDDGELVGFGQAALLDTDPVVGEIHWLHVVPDTRGQGLAEQLLGQIQEHLGDGGAALLRGAVLADNEDGTAFYESTGFERVDDRQISVEDTEYTEYVYEKALDDAPGEAVTETVDGPNGDLIVDFSDGDRGTDGPFYPAYESREFTDRYGWYCGNCRSLDNAMDSMGRIECNNCGNRRKATRWDGSYL